MKRRVRNVRTTRLKPAHHNVGIHRVRAPGVGQPNVQMDNPHIGDTHRDPRLADACGYAVGSAGEITSTRSVRW